MERTEAHLIGTGYYADTMISGVVLGTLADADAAADRWTLQSARVAHAEERGTAIVYRVVSTVDVLDGVEQTPAAAPRPGRSDHRLYDPDPERVVAGDVIRGSVANLLPVGTAIVVEPVEGRGSSHHGMIKLNGTDDAHAPWGSPDDPMGRAIITAGAWFLVLYVPGR